MNSIYTQAAVLDPCFKSLSFSKDDNHEMNMYLEDKIKVDLGPLTWWQKNVK